MRHNSDRERVLREAIQAYRSWHATSGSHHSLPTIREECDQKQKPVLREMIHQYALKQLAVIDLGKKLFPDEEVPDSE